MVMCALINCQTCTVPVVENPFAGIKMKETEAYPESEIQRALAANPKTAQLINDAAKETEIQSRLQHVSSLFKVSSLCPSNFTQIYPVGWTYLNTVSPFNIKCWILKNWWQSPISYVSCPVQMCQNLPCASKGHYCIPTNFVVYTVWSFCPPVDFRIRSFILPQCCECKRFC